MAAMAATTNYRGRLAMSETSRPQSEIPATRRDIYATPATSRRSSLQLLQQRQQARIRAGKVPARTRDTNSLAAGVSTIHRASTVTSTSSGVASPLVDHDTKQLPVVAPNTTESYATKDEPLPPIERNDSPIDAEHENSEHSEHSKSACGDTGTSTSTRLVETAEDLPLFSDFMKGCTASEEQDPSHGKTGTERFPKCMSTSEAVETLESLFTTDDDGPSTPNRTISSSSPALSPMVSSATVGDTAHSTDEDYLFMSGALDSPGDVSQPPYDSTSDYDFVRNRMAPANTPFPSKRVSFFEGSGLAKRVHLEDNDHQKSASMSEHRRHAFDPALLGPNLGLAMPYVDRAYSAPDSHVDVTTSEQSLRYNVRRAGSGRAIAAGTAVQEASPAQRAACSCGCHKRCQRNSNSTATSSNKRRSPLRELRNCKRSKRPCTCGPDCDGTIETPATSAYRTDFIGVSGSLREMSPAAFVKLASAILSIPDSIWGCSKRNG